jgi:hypothetical protein
MMKLSLNTGLIRNVIDVGMYETHLDAGNMYEGDEYEIRTSEILTQEEKDYFEDTTWRKWDRDAYKAFVCSRAVHELADFFTSIEDIISIKLCEGGSIHSPQYYNYETDVLDFDIEIEQSEIDKILPAVIDNQEFWTWCERFRSYSGFYSFMPWTKPKFVEAVGGKDIERALAMYLVWVAEEEQIGRGYYTANIVEYISGNSSIMQFVNDERCQRIADKCWRGEEAA